MHHPRGDIHPDMRLHPEVPLIALLGLVHLRVAALLLVLGRRRGGDDGGIDDRALAHQQAALLQHRPDLVEQRSGQIVPLQPMAEVQQRRRVRHRVTVQVDAGKAAQRLAVVQRIFQRLVGQPVPLLQKVDAAASAPARSAAGRARPSGRAAAAAPPAAPTAPPAPSRPKTCRAASASSCRRIPPAKRSYGRVDNNRCSRRG